MKIKNSNVYKNKAKIEEFSAMTGVMFLALLPCNNLLPTCTNCKKYPVAWSWKVIKLYFY